MVTKADLTVNKIKGTFLWCPNCETETSSDPNDYFNCPPAYKFNCQCGGELELSKKLSVVVPAKDYDRADETLAKVLNPTI